MEAIQRIEQLRKGDLVVRVVDEQGLPVADALVEVVMTRHAFPWGTCVTAAHITGNEPDDAIYRTNLKELFNCAVLENDLKWNAWHGAWGRKFPREQTLAALDWLKAQAFRIRGHCMVYPGWKHLQPHKNPTQEELPLLRKKILEHIDAMAAATSEYVAEWDVVNEPIHHNEVTQALGEGALEEWFSRARAALPASCRLFVNEYNVVEPDEVSNRAKYASLIEDLLAKSIPLEGIGFQGHFLEPPESVEDAITVFDAFAKFGLPIVVTEFDVNTKDETKQATFTHDFMTAAFSHPACDGFLFWGFWEASHWRPDGAMFRKDWSEKPNLTIYRDLVFNEWWTNETGKTNANGEFAVRGFKGSYRIVVGEKETAAVIDDTRITVAILKKQ